MSRSKRKGEGWKSNKKAQMDKKFIRRQIVIKSTSFIFIQTSLAAYQPFYSLCQGFMLVVMLKKSGWGKIGVIPHY